MKHYNINHGDAKMPVEIDEARLSRTGIGSAELHDKAAAAVAKTKNRVTLDSIMSKIVRKEYLYPSVMAHMTICVMMMDNGFAIIGKSAPADPENFDRDLGKKFADEDCIRQIWQLEGYALREKMSGM
jgi:hypothetical protein